MNTITVTIDGREVSGHHGMTILDLAQESGISIPTLCHDPHLTPAGACRICIVEDERSGKLMASCVTPIEPGMIINTQSSRVQDNRKTIVKLMLASHPDTCMVCDKGNSCQLRTIAADMGIGMVEFQQIPQLSSVENVNPFISRDLSKCILCGKCIRADHELVVIGAIDYTGRGFVSKPATLQNGPLETSECTFCGTCVALCPTGALMEKNKTCYGAPVKTIDTICPYCGCGCGISLGIKDNRIIHVKPDKNSPVNNGTLCIKGSYGYDFVHSTDRLTSPMVKTNGEFKKVTWEEGLSLVADQLVRTRNTYGAESIAVFGSSKCTNEDNYVLQKFTRCVLGNNNIDNGSRLYSAAGYTGLGQTVGYPGTTNSLNALEQSEVLLVIGANTFESAPLVDYAIKRTVRNKGARLLVIDPRCTKLVSWAHLWLRPSFGTDVALINGIAKEIIEQGLHNEEYVERKTDNFREMAASLSSYTLEYVAQITGVPSHDIQQAARYFAEATQASIVYGNGLTQYACGTDSIVALANLAMLTGNVTGMGCGIYALQRENNGQGACDTGSLPDFLPGYQNMNDSEVRHLFEKRWRCKIPLQKGLTSIEMIVSAGEGKIKAMYIVGENPALSFPRTAEVKNALHSLDFLVVQDIFMTETAELATVVFPAACFAEKEGSVTNFEGRIQQIQQALDPPGESLPDWKITTYLSEKMGYPMPYSSAQQIMEEITELVPLYQTVDSVEIDIEEVYRDDISNKHPASRRLYKGHFPDGFQKFKPVKTIVQPPRPTAEYPFILMSGSTLYHFGTGARSSRATRLTAFAPGPYVEMCSHDAEQLGVEHGHEIRIISPHGEVTVPVKISHTLSSGQLFMPLPFPGAPVNELFDSIFDPNTKTPAMKICQVKLERTGSYA